MWLQLPSGDAGRRCSTAAEARDADGSGRQAADRQLGSFQGGPSGKTEFGLVPVSTPEVFSLSLFVSAQVEKLFKSAFSFSFLKRKRNETKSQCV